MPGLEIPTLTDLRADITREEGGPHSGNGQGSDLQRSQRGSETSSGHSSCSSSEVSSGPRPLKQQLSDSGMSGMDLSSIAEQVFEDLSISDTDTLETSCPSDITSVSNQSNNAHPAASDVKIALHFNVSSPEEESLYELYRQILDWLDPDSDLFLATPCKQHAQEKSGYYVPSVTMETPCLAVVLYLHESEAESLQHAQQFLSTRPWKFHHREGQVGGTPERTAHYCQDYYMLTADRPLCSVRQVQCGKERLRIIRYVTHKHWKDTQNFYSLILDQKPTLLKKDFCLFVLNQTSQHDVQFVLKKLHKGMVPKKSRKCELYFRVYDIGALVPLFPNVCRKVSDVRWCTKDLDGNRIHLQVPKLPKRCRSVSPSKLYAHYKKSAFSPVVPHKRKLYEDKESQVEGLFLDKLSPRVYISRQLVSRLKPGSPLPSTPHSENSITNIRARPASTSTPVTTRTTLRNRSSSPAAFNSLRHRSSSPADINKTGSTTHNTYSCRTRPSSANELERKPNSDRVRARPLSASTVLDENFSDHNTLYSGSSFNQRDTHSLPLYTSHAQFACHVRHPSDTSESVSEHYSHTSGNHTGSNPYTSNHQTTDPQSPYYFHSHTDSGFVDSTETSFVRDPRRTPIIGNQLSKLATSPKKEESNRMLIKESNTTYANGAHIDPEKAFHIPEYCSPPQDSISVQTPDQTMNVNGSSGESRGENYVEASSGKSRVASYVGASSGKSRVESYVEDQNEMLGIRKASPSNPAYCSQSNAACYSKVTNTVTDTSLPTVINSPTGLAVQTNCDNHLVQKFPKSESDTLVTSTASLQLPPSTAAQSSSPVVVDAAQHDLKAYMQLCWGSKGPDTNDRTASPCELREIYPKAGDEAETARDHTEKETLQGQHSQHTSSDKTESLKQQTPEERIRTYPGCSQNDTQREISEDCKPGPKSDGCADSQLQWTMLSVTNSENHTEIPQDNSNDQTPRSQGHSEDPPVSDINNEISSSDNAGHLQTTVHNMNSEKTVSNSNSFTLSERIVPSTNAFTLGQFLHKNKLISEFLQKTSPDIADQSTSCSVDHSPTTDSPAIHLPDLVQSNDCDVHKSVIYSPSAGSCEDFSYTEAAIDVPQSFVMPESKHGRVTAIREEMPHDVRETAREGGPDDVTDCGLKSCLPGQRAASLKRKRVKFSETNSHHFFEPFEWEDYEDGTEESQCPTETSDGTELHPFGEEYSGISTMDAHISGQLNNGRSQTSLDDSGSLHTGAITTNNSGPLYTSSTTWNTSHDLFTNTMSTVSRQDSVQNDCILQGLKIPGYQAKQTAAQPHPAAVSTLVAKFNTLNHRELGTSNMNQQNSLHKEPVTASTNQYDPNKEPVTASMNHYDTPKQESITTGANKCYLTNQEPVPTSMYQSVSPVKPEGTAEPVRGYSPSTGTDSHTAEPDWQRIKQQPPVGFYI